MKMKNPETGLILPILFVIGLATLASRASGQGQVPTFSTYLGGSGVDVGTAIATDPAGNVYVAGETRSAGFPATAGAFDATYNGGESDGFVAKFTSSGTLLWATLIGGSGLDRIYGLAVDGQGNSYVTGITASVDLPVTPGAFQPAHAGGTFDAFVAKLGPTGSGLAYLTYLGGVVPDGAFIYPGGILHPAAGDDWAFGIAVDGQGNAYVTGYTASLDYPTTAGAFMTAKAYHYDAFVTKLDPAGAGLVYSTLLGGYHVDYAIAIAVDALGSAYVTGFTIPYAFPLTPGCFQTTYGGGSYDMFVTKFDPSGSSIAYSTLVGGDGDDYGNAIAVDSQGNAYVSGTVNNAIFGFPVTAGAFDVTRDGNDAVAFRLNAAGTGLVFSTYIGGSSTDGANGIALDRQGHVYVAGLTHSTDFPVTADAIQTTHGLNLAGADAFVVMLDDQGMSLLYGSYLGGASYDTALGVAADGQGNAYATGSVDSGDFPVSPGAFDPFSNGSLQDAFVTKIETTSVDSDSDGLTNIDETSVHGTDPHDPDTDNDGLLDGTEVDMAMGGSCPNPLVADSDGDSLSDGSEVAAGTNPCNPDTDGDGVPDNTDPLPTLPGVTIGYLQSFCHDLADEIEALNLALFNGPNANANEGRRNSMASRARNACTAIQRGHFASAVAQFRTVLQQIDGNEPTPDWMHDSSVKTTLAAGVGLLITLLEMP